MSKRRHRKHNNEKRPMNPVLYILIVAALVACLAGMFFISRQRYSEFLETRAQIALQETDYVLSSIGTETEAETETEEETETSGRGSVSSKNGGTSGTAAGSSRSGISGDTSSLQKSTYNEKVTAEDETE